MQKGFIVLDSLKNNPDHKPQTLFVQYGQGRVYMRGFSFSYTNSRSCNANYGF